MKGILINMSHLFNLPNLNYNYDELEPFIDAKTMEIHHSKHHQTYVNNLNMALEKYPNLNLSLEEMITNTNLIPEDIRTTVYNNGGGHFNHSFFWKILKLQHDQKPQEKSSTLIKRDFSSIENFKNIFKDISLKIFGSGWAWLILSKDQKLKIITTPNQNNPLQEGTPILSLDVWEHAYYLSYQNRRNDYIEAFFNVINWQQIENNINNALLKNK